MSQDRIKKAIQNMKLFGLSQIIISSPSSIYYLTGLLIEPHERLFALYLNSEGKCVLFANEIFGIEKLDNIDVILHSDKENPALGISKTIEKGKVGIDKFWPSKFLIALMELRSDICPVHGSHPVDYSRAFKDEEEQNIMRTASEINDKVMSKAISKISDGIEENELVSFINKTYVKFGADKEGVQGVSFGKNTADPHHPSDKTAISYGDSIVLDIFTPINHYWCDMTRTVFYKKVSKNEEKIYNIVRKANETAEKIIKPGIRLSEIDFAARKIISDSGYGKYFTHRLGHNIGIDCHEYPDISETSDFIAKPGMIFSVEPGIYIPGEYGVRIEDLVLVTEDGSEVLNKYSKDLIIVK